MEEKRFPMGKRFNSHFGYMELPSEILEVGIFDDFIEFDCVDGVYRAYKHEKPTPITIKKVFSKND